MFFNTKKEEYHTGRCFVFYSFEFNRQNTHLLFDFLRVYFADKFNVDYKFAGYYNESYKEHYGSRRSVWPEMFKETWSNLVNFNFSDRDVRDNNLSVLVEFIITRPVTLTVVLSEGHSGFDLKDFTKKLFPVFRVVYGFAYRVKIDQWATAYAYGNWQNVKNVAGVERKSRVNMESWRVNCEKVSQGFFRDIFDENVVSDKHLQNSLRGKFIKDHILEGLGTLELIVDGIYLWKLQQSELQKARKIIYKTGIII